MKLTKRIAAGLLAVAMMATMAAPAFAVDGAGTTPTVTNYKENSSTVTTNQEGQKFSIAKKLVAPSGWKFESETYKLTAAQESVDKGAAWTYVTGGLPTFSEVSVAANSTGIMAGSENFVVTLPTYSHTGNYVYKITETDNKVQGETYMPAFYMQVQVTAHEDNTGVVNNAYDVYVKFSKTTDFTGNTAQKISDVTNTIKTNTTPDPNPDHPQGEQTGKALTIEKIVKGATKTVDGVETRIDPADTYTIELTLKAAEGYTLSKTVIENNVKAVDQNNNAVALTWADVEGATGTYKTTVTLKNKDKVSFKEIPENTVYTVTETESSATGFTVTYNGSETAATGTVSSNGNDTTVTNQGTGFTPDTGVILDNAPYIVMIAVVAAAAVVFVISKKRREE